MQLLEVRRLNIYESLNELLVFYIFIKKLLKRI